MAKRGGYRPGAGRKKGPEGEAYRQALLQLIDKYKEGLAQALIDKALSGDVPALKEVNERALGKVAQPLAGDKDNPLFPVPILSNMNVSTDHSDNSNRSAEEED